MELCMHLQKYDAYQKRKLFIKSQVASHRFPGPATEIMQQLGRAINIIII